MSALSSQLRLDERPAPAHVAVVDDDVRDARPPADLDEERQVRLAAALDDRDLLAVRVVAERVEDERERDLLGHALDEDRRAREEQLAALRVELAHDPERVVDVDRAQPLDRGDAELVAADEVDLLERGDVEQARRVRREEDLVAARRRAGG